MRTKELVKIKATPEVVKLAKTAMQIQDACNPSAVTNFMQEVIKHFRDQGNGQDYTGSDMSLQNPVTLSALNKLNDLAGLEQSRTDCFVAALDLEEGKDVDWEITFLR